MERVSIVVGGGISGLVAALLIARRRAGRVVVVEREASVGGLLRCFDYAEHGLFDYGMHNMYETGIGPLDALLFGLLPELEWQLLEGNKRDLAGLFYRGRLQLNSPFPDLRDAPELAAFRKSFAAQSGQAEDASSALAYARTRFGTPIADAAIAPAVHKQFRRPAAEMDVMAMQLTSMTRVVLYDDPPFGEMMAASETVRARLGFPEQRRLPARFASGRKGYYPKRYGMQRVIDALCTRLREHGVELMTGCTVVGVERRGDAIEGLRLSAGSGERRIDGVERVLWTTGLPAAAPLLGIDLSRLPFDRPLRTVVVNVLLRQPPRMGDLYYFYCYEPGFRTFRVTNFAAYCEGAPRAGGFPVSVELLLDAEEMARGDAVARAAHELRSFGVIDPGEEFAFARAEPLLAGFPMPSLRNSASTNAIRDEIRALGLRNFHALGILSTPGLFFQKDVLAHTYRSLEA